MSVPVQKFIIAFLRICGVFAFVAGAGIWVTDIPLQNLCRRSCWINDLLFVFFGEEVGKVIYGSFGFIAGAALLLIPRALYRPK